MGWCVLGVCGCYALKDFNRFLILSRAEIRNGEFNYAFELVGTNCDRSLKRSYGVSVPALRGVYLTQPLISLSDRKSTRLNSSHLVISYAVFCLKKKRKNDK